MTPEDDKNTLLNALLPFSVDSIEHHGEFHPHGAAISADGEIRMAMAEVGEEDENGDEPELPDGEVVIEALVDAFKEEAAQGRIRAAAIASNVTIEQDGESYDAIRIAIEHPQDDPPAIEVFMPYARDTDQSDWEFGELQARAGDAAIFAAG